MDKFKCGPILLAFWVLFAICIFTSAEESPIYNVSSEVSALDQAESTRSPRSIGNLARLLLGGTYVMVQLGHMPPDHPLVKYPKPIQTARSNTQSVLAAVPGMNGAPFPFPMSIHHSGLPISRPSFGIGPIPVGSVPSMSYAQLMKHNQPPISPTNLLNAQQHPEKWKDMHAQQQHDSSSSSSLASSSPSLPYNYNSDSPDYTSSTYYTTTGPISSASNDYVDSANPNNNYNYAPSSDSIHDGAQNDHHIDQAASSKTPGIHYPGHRYNPETNSYTSPVFMDFPSSSSPPSSPFYPVDSSSSLSANLPYSSQYSSPVKDYEASFNADMYLTSDAERSPDYSSSVSEPAVSSSSIHPQQQEPPPHLPPPIPPSLPPQQSHIIRQHDRPGPPIYFQQQQQLGFSALPTHITPFQIPRINNNNGYSQQPQIRYSSSLNNNVYSTYPNINSLPTNNNNNNGYVSSSPYSSQNVSPVNNYHNNNLPQQSVVQLSGTIPTTMSTTTTTTTTTTSLSGTNNSNKNKKNNNYKNNYSNYQYSGPTSVPSTSNYDVSTTATAHHNYNNNNNNNNNWNISPPPQETRTRNRNQQVHKPTVVVTNDKVHSGSLKNNYDPSSSSSSSSYLVVNPNASIIKLATEYETISIPATKTTSNGDVDKYYSKNSKSKNKSDERSQKKASKSSGRRHQEEYKIRNSASYEDKIPRRGSSSNSKKEYKEIIRTSESASGSGSESTEVKRIEVDDDNSSRPRSAEKEKRPHNHSDVGNPKSKINEYQSSSSNTRAHYNPGSSRSSSSSSSSSRSNKSKGVVKPNYYSNESSYRKYRGHESNSKQYKTGKTEPPKINYKDFSPSSSSPYFSKSSNSKDPRKSYSNNNNNNLNPHHYKSSSYKTSYSKYFLPPSSKSSSNGGRPSPSSYLPTHQSSKDRDYHNNEYYYRNGGDGRGKKSKENFADLISDDDFEVIFAKRRLEIVDESKTKSPRGNGQSKFPHPHMRRTLAPIQNHNTHQKSYGKPNSYSPPPFRPSPQSRNRNRDKNYGEIPGRVQKNSRENPLKSTNQMSHLNRHQQSPLSSVYTNPTPQHLHHYNHRDNRQQQVSSPPRNLSSGQKSSYEITQSKKSNPSTSTRAHRAILDSGSHEKQLNISNVTLNHTSTIHPEILQRNN